METTTMRIARRAAEYKPSMLTVYDGRDCRGFVMSRGPDGFEAFGTDERSLGKYRTQGDAVLAIPPKEPVQ
jgi:hypothetical protein